MADSSLLIIGAGAAGLLAARDLARAGRRVTVLEARPRLGGRIFSLADGGFSAPTAGGAEFIHGPAPLTRALLREAGAAWHEPEGRSYRLREGQLQETEELFADLPRLLAALHERQEDQPLAEFLAQRFGGAGNADLRAQVLAFAEGFDLADPQRASALALRDEWAAGGAEDSPRPANGYGPLVALLARQATAAGAVIHRAAPVRVLRWQAGQVQAECSGAQPLFTARQALITVPLGVLQALPQAPDALRFEPELPGLRAAAAALGMGSVIKILLEFDHAFWEQAAEGLTRPLPELGFLFSDASIPTWWSQRPGTQPLLTSWLGGPAADPAAAPETLLAQALDSLAYACGTTPEWLRARLRAHRVLNWGADPWARGAYTYPTVGADAARRVLATPIADTLFLAGEALAAGPDGGTVEAALRSAVAAVRQLV